MGRRSTKTTKTGKFMNPTDQWRKQQRRRELKKNKKQRKVVREAVLRMKDVGQMLDEIEEIEKLQMTSLGSDPMPNEKGLEEKKAKLHASVHRVAAYYQGEDPKKAQEIRLMIMDSEKKRRQMSTVYNSYRTARSEYSIDEIPLPDSGDGVLPSDIPMPDEIGAREPGLPPGLVPPGPPPGPPPSDLPDYNVIELERKSVRFADVTVPQDDSEGESGDEEQSGDDSDSESEEEDSLPAPPGPPPGPPPTMLVPPPLHAPPPPPLLAQSFPSRVGLPPGPPPGLPPPRFGGPKPLMPPSTPHIQSGAVLSALPTRSHAPPPLNPPEDKSVGDSGRAAVISAQPQLRNMTAEVTKFMPTSLRVRRNHPKSTKLKPTAPTPPSAPVRQAGTNRAPAPTQGDAYDAFMKEMQGLL